VSSQRGDRPSFRQLGLQLLRIAASCFPTSSILSIVSPHEGFAGCPSERDRLLNEVHTLLESAGPKDVESLNLLGKLHEHGIGTNASISIAIQVSPSIIYDCVSALQENNL
jgi:hypothetical protein